MITRSTGRTSRPGTRGSFILDGAREASRIRQKLGIPPLVPVTPAEVAHLLKVEVLYKTDIKSMEGFYIRDPKPRIVVSSLRPAGRQAFTIGHELGHHVLGHKGHILSVGTDKAEEDEIVERFKPDEIQADAFSAHLLMPKLAVMKAFTDRRLSYDTCTPVDIYTLAWWFGVGYETLIRHISIALKLLSPEHASVLRKSTPKLIRASVLGYESSEDLIPVDFLWEQRRAVDAQVGDRIWLPSGITVEMKSNVAEVVLADQAHTLVQTISPGATRLIHPVQEWAAYLRVSRRQFAGLGRYRFLEDENGDEEENYESTDANN
jgi:Zn-dependent peptidase ImmA (M78 family)